MLSLDCLASFLNPNVAITLRHLIKRCRHAVPKRTAQKQTKHSSDDRVIPCGISARVVAGIKLH